MPVAVPVEKPRDGRGEAHHGGEADYLPGRVRHVGQGICARSARRLTLVADLLVWIDCEMTGLDLGKDALIEVAALVTDPDLNVLGDGVDVVIHADDAALDGMPDVVREMHQKSGLTEEVRRSTVSLAEAEDMVMEYVTAWVPDPRSAPLCGNSIATDRGFVSRDMPRLDAHLHYRMIDVSSIKELCRRWYPRVYFGQPTKGLAHRALADIRESVRELEYYRRTIFVPLPGPDVESAKAIAATL
ncbi:oligoribonuclease [Phytohabitans aurantiacus]|uniref:Oligoribonuclease n=1 Tax=Phytohabitans aurantiacus TaxID=3016789 RepID=A0ABQ5QMG5_9ACTN|nr:oligoribonuclease [Phytohabitans aurantiacus]